MRTLRSMTVKELKELLEDFPDEMMVVTQYDYGDYHHTEAVDPIHDAVPRKLTESGYSRSGFAVMPAEDTDADPEELDEETRAEQEGPDYLVLC